MQAETPSGKDGFNQVTIAWFDPHFEVSLEAVPEASARAEDIAAFRRDGVVCLRGLFGDWVAPLRAGLDRNLADPPAYAFPAESTRAGAPGRYFDSYCNWQRIPEYADFVQRSPAASLAGQFMGGTRAQFFHEHVFLKEPGTRAATPWHQDLPYYCVDGMNSVSIFIALDPIDDAVALRFVQGSHRWSGLFYPKVFLDGGDFNTDDDSLGPVPDIDGDPAGYPLLGWGMAPGDAVLFNFRTLHGTTAAEVKTRRRGFSTRWMGDDITYCERVGKTSPPYGNHGMKQGDPMREDWFPVMWRAADEEPKS